MTDIILDSNGFQNAVKTVAAKIFNDNRGVDGFAVIGIQSKGVFLARRIISEIAGLACIEESKIPFGTLDITLHRDDLDNFETDMPVIKDTVVPFDLDGKNIILIDDVLYTGRTVRAALDVLTDFGRPESIQLAVLVDRGFRELPIEAKYVGVKYESRKFIKVDCKEADGEDKIFVS
ncbi:MAG: bifunctional pyr operon transcriptional regulator/uracil phosphoribosyltransferase PyrR [Endomicrobium sp.]|jgi:pyrimidine operon attenuation protein/uracil phosphoribosyltransferase|nr:bifunctional pyr operon transcriptional regulator/uracil phosphoribosyltransferase PyrR [Endomicrobium sp.]